MRTLGSKRSYRRRATHEGTWAVSYGDMITLLLGFFVLFFSIQKPETGNTLLSRSLVLALENLDAKSAKQMSNEGGTAGSENIQDLSVDSRSVVEQESQDGLSAIINRFRDIVQLILPLTSEGETRFTSITKLEKVAIDKATMKLPFIQHVDENFEVEALDAEVIRQEDKVFIHFPKISFFDSASIDLTKEGREAVEKFAVAYLPFAGSMQLHIVGFADQRPVRRGVHMFRDNLELSVLRAVSTQRLIAKTGIPTQQTRLLGHGVNTRTLPGESVATRQQRLAMARKIMFIIEPGKK